MTIGITGLSESFGRNNGIEEPLRWLWGTKRYEQWPVKKSIDMWLLLFVLKKSKMTMILDRRLAVLGLKMACEANPSPEDWPTHAAWVCESCSAGGDWLAMRKALFLCAFAVHRFSVARASVMTLIRHAGCGPGQATPKSCSWCAGLWGALWGSLWTFSSQQPRWVMYNFLYKVNAID